MKATHRHGDGPVRSDTGANTRNGNGGGKPRRGLAARLGLALPTLGLALLCGCNAVNKYYDPAQPHRAADGFHNNYLPSDTPRPSLIRWQYERFVNHLPKPPENRYRFPIVQPDLAWLQSNRSVPSATWIGHATMLVQAGGVNFLTDPIFSERASPFGFIGPQRKVAPPLAIGQLPHIDVVLISHNHYDHLDLASVQQLNAQPGGAPLFLVPLGVKQWMLDHGIDNVREMDWWERATVEGVRIDFVPAQHWSARGLWDRSETLWGGWAVFAGGANDNDGDNTDAAARKDGVARSAGVNGSATFSFFFAGDTGYSRDFEDIGRKYGGFDLAMIPIGAYAPRWFMHDQHVAPDEAVRIHRDVHAKRSIAIHWGTFELADEPLDEPPRLLAEEMRKAALPARQFTALMHGETVRWDHDAK